MRVSQAMVKDVTAVMEDETIERVLKILSSQLLSGIPVVSEDMKVLGFISENDIINAALPSYFSLLQSASFIPDLNQFIRNLEKLKNKKVSEYMTHPALTVKENAALIHVADLMIRHNLKILPVVDECDKLIGIVTRMDILRSAMEGLL
ncbi:MAG: CBS domain-containing protein [Thermotogae bacterium]|nr:MAG: CBS domain-containing protein [Thermotogota bacterium]